MFNIPALIDADGLRNKPETVHRLYIKKSIVDYAYEYSTEYEYEYRFVTQQIEDRDHFQMVHSVCLVYNNRMLQNKKYLLLSATVMLHCNLFHIVEASFLPRVNLIQQGGCHLETLFLVPCGSLGRCGNFFVQIQELFLGF
jgi:hypothetical protein